MQSLSYHLQMLVIIYSSWTLRRTTWISSSKSTAITFIRKWKTFWFHSVEQHRQWVLHKKQRNELVHFSLENCQVYKTIKCHRDIKQSLAERLKTTQLFTHEVAGYGNSLPNNRKARSSYGFWREVGPVHGKEFSWGLPPHLACQVPELKITVGQYQRTHACPNLTLRQAATQDTTRDGTLNKLGLHYGMQQSLLFSFSIGKRTLSQFLNTHRKLLLRSMTHMEYHSESVTYTTSSKNLSRLPLV